MIGGEVGRRGRVECLNVGVGGLKEPYGRDEDVKFNGEEEGRGRAIENDQ